MHTGAKNVRAWPFSRMRSCFHIETCRPPESALSIENCRHIWKMAVILAGTKSDSGGLVMHIPQQTTSATSVSWPNSAHGASLLPGSKQHFLHWMSPTRKSGDWASWHLYWRWGMRNNSTLKRQSRWMGWLTHSATPRSGSPSASGWAQHPHYLSII